MTAQTEATMLRESFDRLTLAYEENTRMLKQQVEYNHTTRRRQWFSVLVIIFDIVFTFGIFFAVGRANDAVNHSNQLNTKALYQSCLTSRINETQLWTTVLADVTSPNASPAATQELAILRADVLAAFNPATCNTLYPGQATTTSTTKGAP